MTHEEALNCKDLSHLQGDKQHTFGNHCTPCCESLRIYGKVLDAVRREHLLQNLQAQRKAALRQIEKYEIKKDYRMVADQTKTLKELDDRIAHLTAKEPRHVVGKGQLIFDDGLVATVNYWAEGEGSNKWRGQVSHAEGHPDWNPIVSLHTMPFTLVMSDGQKLKVFLESEKGDFHGESNL